MSGGGLGALELQPRSNARAARAGATKPNGRPIVTRDNKRRLEFESDVFTEHPKWLNRRARTVPGLPRTRHPKPEGGGRRMEWRSPLTNKAQRMNAYGEGYTTYQKVHGAWRRLEAAQLRGGLMEQQQALQDHYAPDAEEEEEEYDTVDEQARMEQTAAAEAVRESNTLWTSLYAIIKEAARRSGQTEKDADDWLKPYLFEMQQDHFDGALEAFSLNHPRLRLGDDGMRRVARWMIDNNAHLDGIRSVDFSRQGLSNIGLGFVADAIPLTVREVNVEEDTGYGWAEAIGRLAAELRQRSGGVVYCGPANEKDFRHMRETLPAIPYPGHEVTVHIARLGAMPGEVVISSTVLEQVTFFGSPSPARGGYSGGGGSSAGGFR